ncbi:MAG: hypothetical protein M1834_001849 [Cirrosporium novae-zelandiae]|nr:MAG: hypothetical protein M1834_001849 [Cirrosporium novae-zelandiae]
MVGGGRRRSQWTLRGLSENDIYQPNAVLRWDVLGIRKRNDSSSLRLNELAQQEAHVNKRARISQCELECLCMLSIWNSDHMIHGEKIKCLLSHPKVNPDGFVKIEMERPFQFKVSRFLEVATSCQLQITISPVNVPKDQWPPISLRTNLHVENSPIILVAGWTKLPKLPNEGQHLDLCVETNRGTSNQAKKTHSTKYKLEVNAKYSAPDTPLEKYNMTMRSHTPPTTVNPEARNVPTQKIVSLRYIFKNVKNKHSNGPTIWSGLNGWICPFCGGKDLETWDLLHLHLINSHAYWKITTDKPHQEVKNDSTVNIYLELDTEYQVRAANSVKDHRDFIWTAPKKAFDVNSFCDGDQSWFGDDSREKGLDLGRKSRERNHNSSRSASRNTPLSERAWDPDQIPDARKAHRRKHPVPQAPKGVTFFRSINKRALKTGEILSGESDEDVDETWLQHKHDKVIEASDQINPFQKAFIKVYDGFMLKERLKSMRHLADALVRFSRANVTWFKENPSMEDEFIDKLLQLLLSNLIDDYVMTSCLKIIGRGGAINGHGEMKTETGNHADAMDIDHP